MIPMAAMSLALAPASRMALRAVSSAVDHKSSGSCSTSPSAGKCCGNSRWANDAIDVSAWKRMARVEVVPWSIAST